MNENVLEVLWKDIYGEALAAKDAEPLLEKYFQSALLVHVSFAEALATNLAVMLQSTHISKEDLAEIFCTVFVQKPEVLIQAANDLLAYYDRDPACDKYFMPLLYYKGFQALQAQRVAHELWLQGRHALAFYLQHQMSLRFAVDIHPAAKIGSGIMIDHATGLVVGETAVIGDDVSILHSVTLGGSGCSGGDRHPKIGNGVLISAGANILGNIQIGEGVKIGAGSLVLESVPAHLTVAGVPAKIVGRPKEQSPALEMDQHLSNNGSGNDGRG